MEWVYAAKFHNMPTMEFMELPVEDKVFLIASYRVDAEASAVMAQHRKDYPDEYK